MGLLRLVFFNRLNVNTVAFLVLPVQCFNRILCQAIILIGVLISCGIDHIYLYRTGADFLKIKPRRELVAILLAPAAIPRLKCIGIIKIAKGFQDRMFFQNLAKDIDNGRTGCKDLFSQAVVFTTAFYDILNKFGPVNRSA
jgi:hypothetical protein